MSSIRQVFPIVLSLQITIAVGLTGWISFVSGEKAVQKLTRQLCENLNYRVEQKIQTYLAESVRVNQATSTALTNGTVNPNNLEQVQRDIFNKVKELDPKNILFFGNENGTMVGIERQSSDKFLLRIREDNSGNRPTYELRNDGVRGRKITDEIYDHRTRPWYLSAKQAGKAIWSSIFVSTTDGELSTTKATPIYSVDGTFQGVVGINISLKQISEFMLRTRPTDQWNIFVVEGNGKLVASTSSMPVFEKEGTKVTRFEASQSKDLKLQKAAIAVQAQLGGFEKLKDSQAIEFDFNGQNYIVSTHKISQDLGLDWSVGIIVPKSIFMKEIDENNRNNIIIIVVMLGLNIVIGLAIASWLLQPMKNLMDAAQEIENETFDPENLTAVAHRQDELGQMARVFQDMGNTIMQKQNGMKSQLQKLRQEKDEAKAAALASQSGLTNSVYSLLRRARAARDIS